MSRSDDPPRPLNASAYAGLAQPTASYPTPAYGNPVSTLLESGVGNCFPGLEFDIRQLDVRFFPGLVFEFPGVTPAGVDGTQGAVLSFVYPNDPMLGGSEDWVAALNRQYADQGAALGSDIWYLHWIEQDGRRIDMYSHQIFQNADVMTAYEGEVVWWLIRVVEPNKPLTIALTRREDGLPVGAPVVLTGRRRIYAGADGVFDLSYHAGELTASMCSPWTHDFRDCACQYWASNHPDVVLANVEPGDRLADGTSASDPAQAVTFLDWMRRRDLPSHNVSAEPTIDAARPRRYDPYEINLRWQELDFVLQGSESNRTAPVVLPTPSNVPIGDVNEAIRELETELAPLELTLALEYLYAYFSLKAPEDLSPAEQDRWPQLPDDLRAARQLLLSVALSEMTHLRWGNQILWELWQAGLYPAGKVYRPALAASLTIPAPPDQGGARPRALRPATPEILAEFEFVERPGELLDTEYTRLVHFLHDNPDGRIPPGLYEIAVRIDSDGTQHYQKFRDIIRILGQYGGSPPIYLRPVQVARPDRVPDAMALMNQLFAWLRAGYATSGAGDPQGSAGDIMHARDIMHALSDEAERLARKGWGIPFFDGVPDDA
ncbi:MAG: ferritin-like domain-containing protein [Pseudomonadota bacterium]